jgi:hypothetical protein
MLLVNAMVIEAVVFQKLYLVCIGEFAPAILLDL